jgi:hypothetical protein
VEVNNRNRSLLDLAHHVNECQNCGRWSEHGCDPAHANGQIAEKGVAIKGNDDMHAALCHPCHAWLDQGGKGKDPSGRYVVSAEDKWDLWMRAHFKTMRLYWANGWLKVNR